MNKRHERKLHPKAQMNAFQNMNEIKIIFVKGMHQSIFLSVSSWPAP